MRKKIILFILFLLILILQSVNAMELSNQIEAVEVFFGNKQVSAYKTPHNLVNFRIQCYRYLENESLLKYPINSTVFSFGSVKVKILERVGDGYVVGLSNCSVKFGRKVPIHFKISKNLHTGDSAFSNLIVSFYSLSDYDLELLKDFGVIQKISGNDVKIRTYNSSCIYKIAELDNVRFIRPANTFLTNYYSGEYPDYIYLLSFDTLLNSNFSSEDVVVAVPDSGIASSHTHFKDIKLIYGYDFVDGDYAPFDENNGAIDYGHGTHVAGIISGRGSYSGITVSGASPNAALLISRIFGPDKNGDSISDNYYEVDFNGYYLWRKLLDPDGDGNTQDSISADVISCSWGDERNFGVYDSWSKLVDDIVYGKIFLKRPVFVFSAGNEGNEYQISSPATSKNSITVGACSGTLCSSPASYTQLGSGCGILKPEIFAPGNEILSSVPYQLSLSGYKRFSGTSVAAPFVSALAAQLVEYYPNPTPEFVKAMIISAAYGGSTTDSKDLKKGWGRVSAYQTVFKVRDELVDTYDIGVIGNELTPYPEEKVYRFEVPSDAKYLVATMVYSDESNALGSCDVLNDLDLYLVSPRGKSLLPSGWNTVNDDSEDIVEKYIIKDPEPGEWELHVKMVNFNDLDGRIPKYINYAISIRAIAREENQIYYSFEDGYIYLNTNSTFYGCVMNVESKSGEKEVLVLGDFPGGTFKRLNLPFRQDEIHNLNIVCYNFSGTKVAPELIASLDTHSTQNIGDVNDAVFRIVIPDKSRTYIVYTIDGVEMGGIVENFPVNSQLLSLYSDGDLTYEFDGKKFVSSWVGGISILILEINLSDICTSGGHYLDLSKGLDPFEISGGKCREDDPLKVKQLILNVVLLYLQEKTEYLKQFTIKLIKYYLSVI